MARSRGVAEKVATLAFSAIYKNYIITNPIIAPMTAAVATDPAARREERRAAGVACGAHVLHDGYTDLGYVMLPVWQAEFGLGYAALGLLLTLFSGTLATLQIPAGLLAQRLGSGPVLALGTALVGA